MNILVANNHLRNYGGSETFTFTLVKELRKNHNVDVFTLLAGDYLESVEPKDEYDLLLINHNSCLDALKDVKGFKIFTSHGIFPPMEQPRPGADAYVAISEEVQQHMKKQGYDAHLIRNGIDCDRFSPKTKINKEIKKVLSMCQGYKAAVLIEEACEELGIEFEEIERDVWDVENYINNADLVVTLGRGAYESMACGRAVLLYDDRVYIPNGEPYGDGIVEDWEEIAKHNFSGRLLKNYYTVEQLKEEILKYNPSMGNINRGVAEEHFNIKKQVNKYLQIYAVQRHNQ